ncbi:hypothetical protein OC834_000454 [Tilletia horrida]|uniref:Uncharacterized protein n=1 Tax=Tilletia horrida TaxID=155126 RepID=A0AAN6JJM9_9BASI|nr:hypothetical protein OC842_004347 [Tilletia horrida]KAK0538386.1 hypothetical protein OC834_000454 [Tilletia horrida]
MPTLATVLPVALLPILLLLGQAHALPSPDPSIRLTKGDAEAFFGKNPHQAYTVGYTPVMGPGPEVPAGGW